MRCNDANHRTIKLRIIGLCQIVGHEGAQLLSNFRAARFLRQRERAARSNVVHLGLLKRFAGWSPEIPKFIKLAQHLQQLRLHLGGHANAFKDFLNVLLTIQCQEQPDPLIHLRLNLLLVGALQRHHEWLGRQAERVLQDEQGDIVFFAFRVLGLRRLNHRDKSADMGALDVFRERIKSDRHGRISVRNLRAQHVRNPLRISDGQTYNPPVAGRNCRVLT